MAIDTKKQVAKTTTTSSEKKAVEREFVFGRENYIMMIAGLVVVIIGFVLMYGPADGNIFEFRRITLAPIVVLAGFVIEIFAILRKPKD